jgi:hypothetical protein
MKKVILSLVLLSVLITSCTPTPIPCFDIPAPIHVNTATNFNCQCSKNSGYYEWYIDGVDYTGGSASGSGVFTSGIFSLTFTSTGNHTVELIAYPNGNKKGKSANISKTVSVVP